MILNDIMPFRHGKSLVRRRDLESPIQVLHDEMNDLFNTFLGGTAIEPFGQLRNAATFVPSVNVSEDEKEIMVTAELPGMEQKDIELNVANDTLTIKGEKKEENEHKGKNFYRMERSYGSFQRAIPLTAEVEEDKATASFKNGVLKVRLPKTAKAKEQGKKIEVRSE